MTEYFNNALQTTTDINSQDGGANNKFSAAQSVRKDIAKEFNIPNGKDVVKIAFAVVKAVVENYDGIITENIPENPTTFYGLSKLAADSYILSHQLPSEKFVYIIDYLFLQR